MTDAPDPASTVPREAPPRPSASPPLREVHALSFHGDAGSLFALVLRNLLLTVVTLGVYLPWAKTERRKYLWQNFAVDGHRFDYHGTGRELFFGFAKVIGVYALMFVPPKLVGHYVSARAGALAQLVSAVLLFTLIPYAIWGGRRYVLSRTSWRALRFRLAGDRGAFVRRAVSGLFLTMLTLGVYGPIWANRMFRDLTNATHLGSQPFVYHGDDYRVLRIAVRGLFLTLLTGGVYVFWWSAEVARYRYSHLWFDQAHAELDLSGLDALKLFLIQVFGLTLTLGLAFPWVLTYTMRFLTVRVRFVGHIDFDRMHGVDDRTVGAGADGLADALDVGFAL